MTVTRCLVFAACLGFAGRSFGASPEITRVAPLGIQPGKKTILTIFGSHLERATHLWTSFGGVSRALTNSQEGQLSFEVACPAVPAAVAAVQLGGSGGVSNYELVLIDALGAEPGAKEDHHSAASARRITPPTALDGTSALEKSDYYSFPAQGGEPLSIEVIAQRIGSPMDPVVTVLDRAGKELAYCDDEGGIWRDARFRFTPPSDGEYFLAVHDAGFGGGANYQYRLRVGHDPLIWFSFPLVDPSERAVEFEEMGAGIGASSAESESPANPPRFRGLPAFPSLAEQEPNDAAANAQSISWPIILNGKVQGGDDVDLFRFKAEKGDKLIFESQTRSLGSPCDLVLILAKPDGAAVAQSDSNSANDAALTNQFSETGEYLLKLRELTGTAPKDAPYRIKVEKFKPGISASTEANLLSAAPGGTVSAKISVARFGYSGPVTFEFAQPVEGLSLENNTLAAKKNDADLKIKLSKDFQPGSMLHFKLVAKIETGGRFDVTTEPALRKSFPLMSIVPPALDGLFTLQALDLDSPKTASAR